MKPAAAPPPAADESSPLARYKAILRRVVETRPSGTRQRLAQALGKNRSFVSQIVNPAYATPIPAQHIETIFRLCHFTASEQAAFLAAYQEAHPRRLEVVGAPRGTRQITLNVPDFGDPVRNARADALVRAVADGLAALLPAEPDEAEDPT